MGGGGFAVTPRQLAAASTTISDVLGVGDAGAPPVLGGGAYGHDQLGALVVEFGSAVQVASDVLSKAARAASDGLRAGAEAYARNEDEVRRALSVGMLPEALGMIPHAPGQSGVPAQPGGR